MFGVALVVVGAIFLLKNTGLVPNIAWDIIWPIVLIAFGVAMIFKKK